MRKWPSRSRLVVISACALGVFALSVLVYGRALARGSSGAAVHQSASTNRTITVSGHGEVSAIPDVATVTVGVQTKGIDAEAALATNASKMSAVLDALHAQGITDSHISTSDLSLYFDSQSNMYQDSHTLTVKVDSIGSVGAILDAAVHAGANNAWGVNFSSKDDSVSKAAALRSAIGDARKKADAMATALGVSVAGVQSASETSYTSPIQYGGALSQVRATAASTQIQPGQLSITADVSVVYILN